MEHTFVLMIMSVFFDVVFGCEIPPWVLKRADPGSSSVSFFNNTVSGSFMMARWTWKDSYGGIWDTRLRVTTIDKEDEITGGGFTYFDQYENELVSVRWFKTKTSEPIKWKYTSFVSPPDSWWMTSVVPQGNISWGFKNQITDGSWVFRVGNDTLEPKNLPDVNGWSLGMGIRRKRSLKSYEQLIHTTKTYEIETNQDGSFQLNNDNDYEDDDHEEPVEENIIYTILDYISRIFPIVRIAKEIMSKLESD